MRINNIYFGFDHSTCFYSNCCQTWDFFWIYTTSQCSDMFWYVYIIFQRKSRFQSGDGNIRSWSLVDSDQSINPSISAKVSADGVVRLSGVQPDEEISVLNDTPPTEPLVSWRKEELDENPGMVDWLQIFWPPRFRIIMEVQNGFPKDWFILTIRSCSTSMIMRGRAMFSNPCEQHDEVIHYLAIVGGFEPSIGCRIIRCPCWLDSNVAYVFLLKHIANMIPLEITLL